MEWKRDRIYILFYCISSFFFFFSFVLSSCTTICLDRRCLLPAKPEYLQEFSSTNVGRGEWSRIEIRRRLSGLGSSPPRCTSKCGKCIPCKAVHVTVPPGRPVTTEYYPEAWRCKCHNKLYIP